MTPKELNEIAKKLVAQLGDAKRATIDVVPPGWFRAAELVAVKNIGHTTVQKWLKKVKAEKKMFRVKLDKQIRVCEHYRLK